MSLIDILLSGAVVVLTFCGTLHILVTRTRWEHLEHRVSETWNVLTLLREQSHDDKLSQEVVEQHTKLLKLQAVTENQELRLTDIADTLEHRFNRLRMRQARAQREEEGEEEPVDDETQLRLLQDLDGAQAPEVPEQPRRGRLVPKVRRDPYGRR